MKTFSVLLITLFASLYSHAYLYVCEANNHRLEIEHSETANNIESVNLYIELDLAESFTSRTGQFDTGYGVGPNGEVAYIFKYDGQYIKQIWTGSMAPIYRYDVNGISYRNFWDQQANTKCELTTQEQSCYDKCIKKKKPAKICGFCFQF